MSRGFLVAACLLCGFSSVVCGQELVSLELSSPARNYDIERPVDSKSADFSMGKPGKLIIAYESAPYHGGPGGMTFEKIDATRGLLEEPATLGTTILNETLPKEGGFAERKTMRLEILVPGPLPEGQKFRAWLTGWHEYQAFQIRGAGTQKPAVQKLTVNFIPWDKLYAESGPAAEFDISGKWLNGEAGNTSVMVVTPKGGGEYDVVENGFDEARGTAKVKGRTIYVDYQLTKPGPQQGKRGVFIVTVGKEGKYASGWTVGEQGVGGAKWTYWSDTPVKPITGTKPTDSPTKTDISGTWTHGSNGETWTFTPKGDGSYTAEEQGYGNGKGTATFDGKTIKIDYKTAKGVDGQYEVTLNPDGKSGKGKWSDSSPDGGVRDFTKHSSTTIPTTNEPGTDNTGFSVKIGNVKVKAGETVTLPVEVIKPADVSSLNVEIGYSAAVANVKEKPVAGALKGNRLFEANHGESGVVLVGLAGSAPLNSDGQLAVIAFTAVGKPGEKTPLTVKVTSANLSNGGLVTAATIDGELEIVSQSRGDINNDDVVDPRDALDALKMSVRLLPVNLAADMDDNGVITANDARMILLKAVGK